ncbi:MAG: four helix bundle protein [Patescibacteria group bacterium]|nr:four helix bundle protein [Patescibacteria group bacterium]
MESKISSYRDLTVWQKSMNLVDHIYDATESFPQEEKFGLSSQMQRAAVAIPSNISEGHLRGTRKEYARFISIALASSGELDTQLEIARRRKYLLESNWEQLNHETDEVKKMLSSLYKKLIYIK